MERFKADALMYIYNTLLEGKVVKKNDVVDKFNINERTFYRYIKDIKNFVENPEGDLIGEQIIVGREKCGYVLKGKTRRIHSRDKYVWYRYKNVTFEPRREY